MMFSSESERKTTIRSFSPLSSNFYDAKVHNENEKKGFLIAMWMSGIVLYHGESEI